MLHHCCISSHTKTYADNPDEQDKQTGQYFDKAWARRGQAGPDKTRRRTTQDPQQRSGQGTAIMASHFFPAALRGFFCRNLLHNTSVSISYSGSHLKQLHWYVCYKYICSLHAWSSRPAATKVYMCKIFGGGGSSGSGSGSGSGRVGVVVRVVVVVVVAVAVAVVVVVVVVAASRAVA